MHTPNRYAVTRQGRQWAVVEASTMQMLEGGFVSRESAVAAARQWEQDDANPPAPPLREDHREGQR
jgi:hypothetical protein